ncbi:SMP-30/gluconolactonase/LRE family protein [Nocardioides lijunqiniae]|uniref:SMP-30/gluconolactonase/LRE family protein n=1 Tax=Nocardioides lijunqiniae TaxID=2760832 RepID=UPI001877882C|nr:SMP-30/gluconolactonase/LRE family protein [Nocardioides lijunqiniae]
MTDTTTVLTGLHFAEAPTLGPDGHLYLSDFYAHEVLRVDVTDWSTTVVATVEEQPSGLGWLADGSLLVVSMNDRRLRRLDPDGTLHDHADLSGVARGSANDMYVDQQGRAWVGDFGFDFYGLLRDEPDADPLFGPDADPPTASIALVTSDGTVTRAAEGLQFPNGMVELSDGRLVVAETVGKCLTAFDVDGHRLINRRQYADLRTAGPGGAAVLPDGICVDAEDGIWVSDPAGSGAVRIAGGEVRERVSTSQPCFAVGLVGDQLVCCTAESSNPNVAGTRRTGRLEVCTVTVPGP